MLLQSSCDIAKHKLKHSLRTSGTRSGSASVTMTTTTSRPPNTTRANIVVGTAVLRRRTAATAVDRNGRGPSRDTMTPCPAFRRATMLGHVTDVRRSSFQGRKKLTTATASKRCRTLCPAAEVSPASQLTDRCDKCYGCHRCNR